MLYSFPLFISHSIHTILYLLPFLGVAMFLLIKTPLSSSSVLRRDPFFPDFFPLFFALAKAVSISSSVW